jgi:hypothetical protein
MGRTRNQGGFQRHRFGGQLGTRILADARLDDQAAPLQAVHGLGDLFGGQVFKTCRLGNLGPGLLEIGAALASVHDIALSPGI